VVRQTGKTDRLGLKKENAPEGIPLFQIVGQSH